MFKIFFTIFLLFSLIAVAGDFNAQRAHKVTAEDEARFEEKLKNANTTLSYPKLANELGRTWYDYATNNVMGRMMAHAYGTGDDGVHFVFMKRQPDATGNRYVTYDYWDLGLGLYYGNQSITENQPTGWGRAINGKDDELITVFHGGGLHLYQDAGEAGYSFTELWSAGAATGGVFPGIAVTGATVFVIGQLTNGNWFGGDTISVSTDYMQTWSIGNNIWPPDDPLMTDFGVGEMWPTFNPTVPNEISVVYAPDITAASPNGITKMATTNDFGANWTLTDIIDDDFVWPGNEVVVIENFAQYNSMYGLDGTYHLVIGATQGRTTGPTGNIDMHPLLYWNTRDQQFIDLAAPEKSRPADTTAQNYLQNNDPGNGLGGLNYPTLSEGPNGELVAIWQEWEDDGTGVPVLVTPPGGNLTFCTDIWGAYSDNGGLSWGEPFFIAGTASESDVYPNITKNFSFNAAGDSIILDVAYMWDTNAGTSLFAGGNDASEVIWYYERVTYAEADIVNDVGDLKPEIVNDFRLEQNFPNPFNPSTSIKFNVKKATEVTLDVFNVLGEKVATLINGKVKAGETVAKFDGTNFSSGVYFYQLTADDFVKTHKMLLVK